MTQRQEMDTARVLDTVGACIASMATLAAKVPAKSFQTQPIGARPTEEAIEHYETTVYRFRDQAGATWRVLNGLFIASLEAFEAGRIFDAVPPLFQALEHVVELHQDGAVSFTPAEQDRIRDFHRRLTQILPDATKPEMELPTPETY